MVSTNCYFEMTLYSCIYFGKFLLGVLRDATISSHSHFAKRHENMASMYGCATWQGNRLIKWNTLSSTNGPPRWWDLSLLHDQNIVTVFGLWFIPTIIKCFLWLKKERGRQKMRQKENEGEIGQKQTEKVTSCVNFYSNSLKGYIKLYHIIQPPWNNLYANKALHMVGAVCSSAGKIFYVVSEFLWFTDVL